MEKEIKKVKRRRKWKLTGDKWQERRKCPLIPKRGKDKKRNGMKKRKRSSRRINKNGGGSCKGDEI